MDLPTPAPPFPTRRVLTLPLAPRENCLRTPELLCMAFSFLARHDLVSVVRVCRLFCDEGQRWLYRVVELSSELPNVLETIALLETDSVGAYVKEATLTTVSPRTTAWFPPNLVLHWINLQRLELFGVPFEMGRNMDVFRTTLHTYCRNLRFFSYRHDACMDFPVGEICFLTLDSGRVDQSAHSLTHITLAGSVLHHLGSSFDTLIHLRFPNLKSLELGPLVKDSMSVSYAETTAGVTRFVSAHTLLEHLSLGMNISKGARPFHLDGHLITPSFLPNLRSFGGSPRTVAVLVGRCVLSIFSLATLSLFVYVESDISAMVGAIKSSPRPSMSTVQNLKVQFLSIARIHEVPFNTVSVMRRHHLDEIADVCPNVTNWFGNLPMMKGDQLKDTLRSYSHLETISVPWYTLLIEMNDTQPFGANKYFALLAGSLRSLETVVALRPPHTNLMDTIFTILRDSSGELSQVVSEEVRLEKSSL